MKLRNPAAREDPAFDGLTKEDIRRIRGGAAASVTPGLEGLVPGGPAPKPGTVVVPAGTEIKPQPRRKGKRV